MKYILILIMSLHIRLVPAKDLELGLLDNIEDAVRSEMPLQQELNLFVEMGPDGYTTPMELDASVLQMNGYTINISGLEAVHKLKSKSVYYDYDLVVEFDAETESESKYINAVGPDGIEGRVDISGGTDLVYYYIKDHLGSITGSVFQGQLQEAKFYYAYGNTKRLSVAAKNAKEGYTGKEFDEDGSIGAVTEGMKLHYFGARYYDSDIGQWISPDPMKQFNSLYSTGGNPVINVDPNGLTEYTTLNEDGTVFHSWRDGNFSDRRSLVIQNGAVVQTGQISPQGWTGINESWGIGGLTIGKGGLTFNFHYDLLLASYERRFMDAGDREGVLQFRGGGSFDFKYARTSLQSDLGKRRSLDVGMAYGHMMNSRDAGNTFLGKPLRTNTAFSDLETSLKHLPD